jgi:hypothetical protein
MGSIRDMTLDDIDEAVMLRNHRAKAMALADAARSGPIDLRLARMGEKFDAFSIIPAMTVRDAVVLACQQFIAEIDGKLSLLGVAVPTKSQETATP